MVDGNEFTEKLERDYKAMTYNLITSENHMGGDMNKEDIIKLIARHTCEVIPELAGHVFQTGDVLKDLGANSVDRSEIVMMTLESLSLKVPLIEIAGARNIGELASILYDKSQTV